MSSSSSCATREFELPFKAQLVLLCLEYARKHGVRVVYDARGGVGFRDRGGYTRFHVDFRPPAPAGPGQVLDFEAFRAATIRIRVTPLAGPRAGKGTSIRL